MATGVGWGLDDGAHCCDKNGCDNASGFFSFSGIREKEKLLHSNEMKEEKNL